MKRIVLFALSLALCLSFVACGDKTVECEYCTDGERKCGRYFDAILGNGAPHKSNCSECGGDGKVRCNICDGKGWYTY